MKSYSANSIRNIAVLGHSGSGKTSFIEAALFESGTTKRMGRVEDGNTVSDYDAEEIKRKVSINTSIIPIEYKDTKINFLDTPGYFDFAGQVKEALAAADLALIIISAKSGIEGGVIKAWEYAEELGLPKMIFVNNMDDENSSFDNVVEQLRAKFGKTIAPLQHPYVVDGKFEGFINIIRRQGRKGKDEFEIPESEKDAVEAMRLLLSESVAETDDALMEKFFADEEFTPEEISDGLEKGILEGIVTPVVCGVAVKNIGIMSLLGAIDKFVPSADKVHPEAEGINPKTEEKETRLCKESEPFSAFVFKTIADPYIGRLNIFKVMSGVLKKDMQVYNSKMDAMEKIAHVYILRGKEQIEVDQINAGDIGAVAKLDVTKTQHTLCDKNHPILYPKIAYPPAYTARAIVPKGKGDEDKISSALAKLMEEDKTLHSEVNKETKQSLVYGVGDQHLDLFTAKLKSKYKIDVDLAVPITPYREMIKGKAKVQGKYKKQSGGHGQYGDVWIEFEPSGDLETPVVFEEKVFGGAVPRNFFPAVEKGLQEAVLSGVLAGYPVVGLKARLVDGSYHPVDSSEMAFKMATSVAFKEGLPQAKPTILEPYVKVQITVPDEYTGDIMGDMNKRRGRILGMNPVNGKQVIDAEAPQSEMYQYSTDLRSMTQSMGTYTMHFERYEEAPAEVQQKIIAARKKEKEGDK